MLQNKRYIKDKADTSAQTSHWASKQIRTIVFTTNFSEHPPEISLIQEWLSTFVNMTELKLQIAGCRGVTGGWYDLPCKQSISLARNWCIASVKAWHGSSSRLQRVSSEWTGDCALESDYTWSAFVDISMVREINRQILYTDLEVEAQHTLTSRRVSVVSVTENTIWRAVVMNKI